MKSDFGLTMITNDFSEKWSCVARINVESEIEKIASGFGLCAIGTAAGDICLLGHQSLEVHTRWNAHPNQPITALEFKNDDFLFSAGHNVGTELIFWNISKHKSMN